MTTPKPSPQPSKQPVKTSKKVQWIVFGAAGLFGLCCVSSYVRYRDSSGTSQRSGRNVSAAGTIGTAVREGEFEVRSVQCGIDQIGPDDADELAQLELHRSMDSAGVKIDLR
jgi:hypothetical protein